MADVTANEALIQLEQRASAELREASDEAALRAWNTKYFSEKGEMNAALRLVGTLPGDQRKAYGQDANRVKQTLTAAYDQALATAKEATLLAESPT